LSEQRVQGISVSLRVSSFFLRLKTSELYISAGCREFFDFFSRQPLR
jgi:hypothetical protein